MVQVPLPTKLTVVAEIVQTPELPGASEKLTGRPELAAAPTVYEPPTTAAGGDVVKVIDCALFDAGTVGGFDGVPPPPPGEGVGWFGWVGSGEGPLWGRRLRCLTTGCVRRRPGAGAVVRTNRDERRVDRVGGNALVDVHRERSFVVGAQRIERLLDHGQAERAHRRARFGRRCIAVVDPEQRALQGDCDASIAEAARPRQQLQPGQREPDPEDACGRRGGGTAERRQGGANPP